MRKIRDLIKKEKGITLIALVITIIVLIILATVAINMTLGDNGIFQRAKTATKQMSIESAKEKLETEKASASVKTKGQKVTLADYIATVREDNVADDIAEASSGDYALVVLNGYVFRVEEKDNDISITYMGISDEISLEAPSAEGVLTITLSKTGWTNENITATANGSEEGYTVQMSLDGTTWTETNTLTITENTTVYACLYNGLRYGAATTETVSNIDKQKPATPTITNPSNGEETYSNVTLTISSSDDSSGIAKYQVYYGGEWHDKNETGTFTEEYTTTMDETIKYKAIDNAGNESDEATTVLKITKASITTESGTITTGSQDFTYTGSEQTITLTPGNYKLEVWGAQGGGDYSGNYGGKGAYATGNYNVTSTITIYAYVGGQGTNARSSNDGSSGTGSAGGYNGGAYGGGSRGPGGGGATDFRTINGTWNNSDSLNSRLIVAGGGGGDAVNNPTTSKGRGNVSGNTYTLGQGANGNTGYSGKYPCDTGGGGGGYYGGSSISGDDPSLGYGGTSIVNSPLTNGTYFEGDNSSMPAPGGETETGHSGNGYARITIIAE